MRRLLQVLIMGAFFWLLFTIFTMVEVWHDGVKNVNLLYAIIFNILMYGTPVLLIIGIYRHVMNFIKLYNRTRKFIAIYRRRRRGGIT